MGKETGDPIEKAIMASIPFRRPPLHRDRCDGKGHNSQYQGPPKTTAPFHIGGPKYRPITQGFQVNLLLSDGTAHAWVARPPVANRVAVSVAVARPVMSTQIFRTGCSRL